MTPDGIGMRPIGIIYTPSKNVSDCVPIQGWLNPEAEGEVGNSSEYHEAGSSQTKIVKAFDNVINNILKK